MCKHKNPTESDLCYARLRVHGEFTPFPPDDAVVRMYAREIMHTRIRVTQMARGVQKVRWEE